MCYVEYRTKIKSKTVYLLLRVRTSTEIVKLCQPINKISSIYVVYTLIALLFHQTTLKLNC